MIKPDPPVVKKNITHSLKIILTWVHEPDEGPG